MVHCWLAWLQALVRLSLAAGRQAGCVLLPRGAAWLLLLVSGCCCCCGAASAATHSCCSPMHTLCQVFSAKPYLALVMEFVPNGDMFQVCVRVGGA